MSSQDMNAELVAEFAANIVYGYCQLAAGVLFIYECLITGYEEVEFFWKARWTGATALFLANRYFSLGWYIYNIIGSLAVLAGPHYPPEFRRIPAESGGKCTIVLVFSAAAAGLRALGVSRSWPLAAFIFCLHVVPFALEFIAFHYGYSAMYIAGVGCVAFDHESYHIYKASQRIAVLTCSARGMRQATIAGQACSIAADGLVILVTWLKLSRGMGGKHGLAYILLRDGTAYFLCFLVLGTLHLVLTLLSLATPFQPTSYVQYFMEPLTGIFVSRFLINLQRANRRATHMDSSIFSRPNGDTDLVFERVVGSLGSTLEYDDDEVDEVDGDASETIRESAMKAEAQCEPHASVSVSVEPLKVEG
ncbi:hypothetical protein L227DRAFT_613800 [Lentinus tigrinus ALCF2SS1-6]|uniref:DUF6533 domain-containing protein n=1 Tax=Lentinus tigrinus ALCF2SS1-6 TaxID=1328759 RepID=A0A5C2S1F1_9APHY|nr:hypothetical protein L227DRAFT_613800 [Lentinus tigrinus ALCF2SS1-6]